MHADQTPRGEITIHIDAKPYIVPAGRTAVTAILAMRRPPAAPDARLWLDIEDAQDQQLAGASTIDLVEGMRFFTEIDPVRIRIDRLEYEVYAHHMTGLELRTLPSPDIAADRDLWRDVPDKRDVKVQNEDVVRLHDGLRFFTAPGHINPGNGVAA